MPLTKTELQTIIRAQAYVETQDDHHVSQLVKRLLKIIARLTKW